MPVKFKFKVKSLEKCRTRPTSLCWDTRSHVPTRNDPSLLSLTTKTSLSGAPTQSWGGAHHTPHICAHTRTQMCHNTNECTAYSLGAKRSSFPSVPSLPLQHCLFQPLWGACLSTEHGDCSIAEKMYKMLPPLFYWALSIYSRTGKLQGKLLCWALKMSSWI